MKLATALCGGGIRGIIPAYITAFIEKELKKPFRDVSPFIGGTSTGAILACGLMAGRAAQEILDLYLYKSKLIFSRSAWDIVSNPGGARGPLYGAAPLEKQLKKYMLGKKLIDVKNPYRLLVASMNLSVGEAVWFDSDDAFSDDFPLWQIARASSAAPTYFPPFLLRGKYYIDGGLHANNPSAEMASEINISYPGCKLMCLGTGASSYALGQNENPDDWGVLQWGFRISDIFIEGQETDSVMTAISELDNSRYAFFEPQISNSESSIDNVSEQNIQDLLNTSKDYVSKHGDDILSFITK